MTALAAALDEIATRQVILFGGKGGVGKTTLSAAAAAHLGRTREVHLLRVETLDAELLYRRFLGTHLDFFVEIGDRGTYLDKEELRRLLELALPGVDELMTWMHIGELAEENPETLLIVDTAPTGHTLRMLSSSEHFRQLALALDAMQEKHRSMVRQFTRRDVRDAADQFIEEFDARAERRRALLLDPARTAFVPVMLSEPLVVEQTLRLVSEIEIDVPFVILNRAVVAPDCPRDEARAARDADARTAFAPRKVVDAPRSCVPIDSAEQFWSASSALASNIILPPSPPNPGEKVPKADEGAPRVGDNGDAAARVALPIRPIMFFAGKGGVGKTTCASSVALQLANAHPDRTYVVISVDPAHSLRDVFEDEQPPSNLRVEIIDTRAKWRRFRDTLGQEIENAINALTPRGMSLAHDSEAMRQLIEIAPPGADELFAIIRLADLTADTSLAGVIVDTAPTGHFLRLLDLPRTAGEWVREFMRLLLRYRDVLPAGSLGEELVRASRALKDLESALHSERSTVVVVTRPEKSVVEETKRLLADVRGRGIHAGSVIANYVTPENDCRCDQSMRAAELGILDDLAAAQLIERRDAPPRTLGELATLVRLLP